MEAPWSASHHHLIDFMKALLIGAGTDIIADNGLLVARAREPAAPHTASGLPGALPRQGQLLVGDFGQIFSRICAK